MLKILHIIPNLKKGGAERLVIDICGELAKRKDVLSKLITFSPENEYSLFCESLDWSVIPAQYVPSLSGRPKSDLGPLSQFISEYKPDVIHSHLWESEVVMSQIKYPHSLYVSHFHSGTEQIRKTFLPVSKQDFTDLYERNIVLRAYKTRKQHFVAISKNTEAYIARNLPRALSKNTTLLHNAINADNFINTGERSFREHTRLKLVSVGRLDANKNHQFLIDVVDLLDRRGIDSTLTVLGEGGLRERLVRKVSEKNLNDRIFFRGNMDNIAPVLWGSDIYVHSAKSEALGLTMIEAMAAGLPVVCLDGGGNRDLILNGKNGFILNTENVGQFAEKIGLLFNDKSLLKGMSIYAQNHSKQFGISKYVDSLLMLYQS